MTEFTAYLRGNNFRPIEAKVAYNELEDGDELILLREPGNQYDPNAIMVLQPDTEIHLGYVAKEVAIELASMMDEGQEFHCKVDSHMMKSVILVITDFVDEGEPFTVIDLITEAETNDPDR